MSFHRIAATRPTRRLSMTLGTFILLAVLLPSASFIAYGLVEEPSMQQEFPNVVLACQYNGVIVPHIVGIAAMPDGATNAELQSRMSQLRSLQWVSLMGPHATDEWVVACCSLPELRSVELTDTSTTHRALESLKGMRNLRELHLCKMKLNDDDIKALCSLQSLGSLVLLEMSLSQQQVDQLVAALPTTLVDVIP